MTYRPAFGNSDFADGGIQPSQVQDLSVPGGSAATLGTNTFTSAQTVSAPIVNQSYLNLVYKKVTISDITGTTYNLNATNDCILEFFETDGVQTVQLPQASTCLNRMFIIKFNSGFKSLTIKPYTGELINQFSDINLSVTTGTNLNKANAVTIQSIGSGNWVTV